MIMDCLRKQIYGCAECRYEGTDGECTQEINNEDDE